MCDPEFVGVADVCKNDPSTGLATTNCKTTTDLGQALIDGNFDHVGKIKGPILRGLSARAPYFHNGSAQDLRDVVGITAGSDCPVGPIEPEAWCFLLLVPADRVADGLA